MNRSIVPIVSLAVAGAMSVLACEEPAPRVPVSDHHVDATEYCHKAGSVCHFDDDCCSGNCNYPMVMCR
jgi:hypothetical protein